MIGWKYMTKNAAVVPFSKGTVVYVDGMLSTLYYKTKERGFLKLTMCGDEPNHDQFIRMFEESKKVLQVLCEVENQGTPEEQCHPVGYAWVEVPKGVDGERAAMCGFCFFKRSRYMYDLGMLGIYYWMDGLKINVIHGVMLESNRPAKRFAEKLGFVTTAVVPKFHYLDSKLVWAREMMVEDNDFLRVFEPWFESRKVSDVN